MGIVYEAEQTSLGRRVAIKVLRLAALLDEQRLGRFRNEARAAAMLDHPSIVRVLSVGCERGVHYYAMSLVDGQSLAEVVAKLRPGPAAKSRRSDNSSLPSDAAPSELSLAPVPPPSLLANEETSPIAQWSTGYSSDRRSHFVRIARLFAQIAHALHYAHQQGVVIEISSRRT